MPNGSKEVELLADVDRRIWFRLNGTVVHGGEFQHPNDLIIAASFFLGEYKSSMERNGVVGVCG